MIPVLELFCNSCGFSFTYDDFKNGQCPYCFSTEVQECKVCKMVEQEEQYDQDEIEKRYNDA